MQVGVREREREGSWKSAQPFRLTHQLCKTAFHCHTLFPTSLPVHSTRPSGFFLPCTLCSGSILHHCALCVVRRAIQGDRFVKKLQVTTVDKLFIAQFITTNAFIRFVEERIFPSIDQADVCFFDESIIAKRNRSAFTPYKVHCAHARTTIHRASCIPRTPHTTQPASCTQHPTPNTANTAEGYDHDMIMI